MDQPIYDRRLPLTQEQELKEMLRRAEEAAQENRFAAEPRTHWSLEPRK